MALRADPLVEMIKTTPFPSDSSVKIRVLITGLAFCLLNNRSSRIRFLRHVPNHALNMVVLGRKRGSPTAVIENDYPIALNHQVSVKIANPDLRSDIETAEGPYHLDDMVNLHNVHRAPVDPNDFGVTDRPSDVLLPHCGFYTFARHPRKFDLVDSAGNGDKGITIGYVLGGKIRAKRDSQITIASLSIGGGELMPDINAPDGTEKVYDIIFNNHCTEPAECVKHAGGLEKTDFHYYYEVLGERGNEGRKFKLNLVPRRADEPAIEGDFLTVDVAACNPVIITPLPGEYSE